jgi:hypothetical protein
MKNNTIPTTDLAEARSSLTRLLPHLPWPKLTEKMNYCGLLPNVGGEVAALPIVTQPEALMMEIGPWIFRKLPEQWKPAYYFNRRRLFRNAQVLRLHPACQAAGDDVLADLDETTDGVVAGMLLLSLRPLPGQLRTALLDHCHQDGWGTYFAALGTVYAHETAGLLAPIANDPRLAAGLYRENADLAAPLIGQTLRQNDVWSATIALQQATAAQWLDRVVPLGRTHPVAAVTALTLLPAMSPDLRRACMECLRHGNPRLAYLAARWTRHTWPADEWRPLCDSLRTTATRDRGQNWFHWFRDVEPGRIDEALSRTKGSMLWQVELIEHAKKGAQELRRRMAQQLREKPDDNEARFTLRWLRRHGREA